MVQLMRPRAGLVLAELERRGEEGAQTGDLTRLFDQPELTLRRNLRVNQILHTFWHSGHVRRSDTTEPTAYYNNTPVYRWFITRSGSEYLTSGMQPGRHARAQARRQMREQARQQEFARQAALLASVTPSGHKCQRDAEIRHLRAEMCVLDDIGRVFGLNRERIRQIASGLHCHPCEVPGHDYFETPCSHGLVTAPRDSGTRQEPVRQMWVRTQSPGLPFLPAAAPGHRLTRSRSRLQGVTAHLGPVRQ